MKKYWHELSQKEVDKVMASKITLSGFMKKFKQPDWCGYSKALSMDMGCWSLCDTDPNGLRTKISKEYCQNCDCFKKNN